MLAFDNADLLWSDFKSNHETSIQIILNFNNPVILEYDPVSQTKSLISHFDTSFQFSKTRILNVWNISAGPRMKKFQVNYRFHSLTFIN
jgi:hypothetical protein